MKILISFFIPFIPIAKALKASGHEIVTMHPNFTKALVDNDIPARSLSEFLTNETHFTALSYAAKVSGQLSSHSTYTPPQNMTPAGREFLYKNLAAFMYNRLADVSTFIAAVENFSPDFVLVHNDVDPVCRAAALWAKSHNKICLHVPHAVHMDVGRSNILGADIHDLITASHLVVAGPYHAQWYLERGASPKTIRVIGLPQFDRLSKPVLNRERACQLLGLNPSKPVITYASSWRQDTNLAGCHDGVEEWYIKFLDAIKILPPGLQVIVKLHPNAAQNGQWHVDRAKERDIHCLVMAAHLDHVIAASDLLIAYGPSNILLEASLNPNLRLAVSHGFSADDEVIKFGENAKPEEVAGGIHAVLSAIPVDYSVFRVKYMGKLDGNATKRIVEYIEELCPTSAL